MKKKLNEGLYKIAVFIIQYYLKWKKQKNRKSEVLNERSLEYSYVLRTLIKNKVLDVVDVGTGSNSFSATMEHCGYNVIATDYTGSEYWTGFNNRHVYIVNDDITNTKLPRNSFDAVTCISVLEHIPEHNKAVSGMVSLLKKDGIMIITCPFSYDTYCPNVYKLPESDANSKKLDFICQSYCDENIKFWLENNDIELINTEYFKGWEGKLWRTGNKIIFPINVENKEEANGICLTFRKK